MPRGIAKNNKLRSEKISKSLKIAHSKGKKFGFIVGHPSYLTEETKKKISNSNKGKQFSVEHRKNLSKASTGRYLSGKTKELISKFQRGKKVGFLNPSWKGGITPIASRIRNSYKYRQWVSDVFTRDDFTCQNCGVRGCYLEAHHIKSFAQIIYDNNIDSYGKGIDCQEIWDINNGETLCKKCHKLTDNYKGRNKIKQNYR